MHNIVRELKKELGFDISGIQINFVNSKEIMRINKEYLDHNYSTDIVTFDYSESQKNLEGEIYISFDDAASNAKKYKEKLKEEIMRLVIHGFLHLLGFNDQSKKERIVMKKRENQLYNRYTLLFR
ncbi:MAG: rRNA maturation RNase YbeY [Ignavibacteria bacterium RBG_16_34_14]|nr:MAG: rRNA maturation RNase YbeY [Ignavibacteria bacterium RBG_16_34_14]